MRLELVEGLSRDTIVLPLAGGPPKLRDLELLKTLVETLVWESWAPELQNVLLHAVSKWFCQERVMDCEGGLSSALMLERDLYILHAMRYWVMITKTRL